MPRPTTCLRVLALALLAALPALLPACEKAEAPPPSTIVVHSYTVRGQVEQLPTPGDARKEFMVRHEEIPEYKGSAGETGMKAMVMPFPLASGLSLEGLKVGDKITLTFTVDFDEARDTLTKYRATAWAPLDPATPLDFTNRAKKPPTP